MAGKYDAAKTHRRLIRGALRARATTSSKFRTTASARTKPSATRCSGWRKTSNIPLIATNDSHYIAADDTRAHEILLCVQTAGSMNDPKRFKFDTQEFYIKSADEMRAPLRRHARSLQRAPCSSPSAATSSSQGRQSVPEVRRRPKARPSTATSSGCAAQGWQKRLETAVAHLAITRHAAARPSPSMKLASTARSTCIKQMKFPGYFMIVWDFIRYAREHNIPVGPGRGSAAGSLVAYVMEITDIDPLQNELLFERFLNPERVSMPDIDIDFCMNRRGEVIEYVTQQVWRRSGRPDHHLQHHGCEGRHQGRRPRARHALRRSRSHRQADSRQPSASPSSRRSKTRRRSPQAYESDPRSSELIDTAHAPRRPRARRRRSRRRRRHRAQAAHRTRSRHAHQGRGHRHHATT